MALAEKAIKHGTWFALFRGVSQAISWVVTVVVARLLSPADYALSAMATLITGYAELLSEMGIGASIIQKKAPTEAELSSIFWFSLGVGLLFALACIPIAFLTARIFDEPRVIPLIFSISILFVLTGLQVVPLSLLKRDLNYKAIGIIEMQTTIVSCLCMLVIAYFGGGVWTLIGGRIIRGLVRLILVYRATTWRPTVSFNLAETSSYLQFGVTVAVSSSAFYVFEVADRLFAGRAWSAEALGFYLFAMQLAQVPNEKLVSTINQVTYPLFSRYQDDLDTFSEYYLVTIKLTAALVFPIYVMGYLLGHQLIPVLLGTKWTPMITLFKFLCLAQIFVTLNAVVGFVHMALGRPARGLYFNIACAVFMSVSYYLAVNHVGPEKESILLPWFTTYAAITIVWLGFTNLKLRISTSRYLKSLRAPFLGMLAIAATVGGIDYWMAGYEIGELLALATKIACSLLIYGAVLWLLEGAFLRSLLALKAKP